MTAGIDAAGLEGEVRMIGPEPADDHALERVHQGGYIAAVTSFCVTGGGNLDPDTGVVPASLPAAPHAAGSRLIALTEHHAGRAGEAL